MILILSHALHDLQIGVKADFSIYLFKKILCCHQGVVNRGASHNKFVFLEGKTASITHSLSS